MPYDKTKPYSCPCCGYWNGDMKYDYYKHQEPRIEDEDARSAVRLWASVLQISEVKCKKIARDSGVEVVTLEAFRLGSVPRIEFASWSLDADVTDGEIYTIDELCGEEVL